MTRGRALLLAAATTLALSLSSCSKGNNGDGRPVHPIREAYQLLDEGSTAKAMVILTDFLKKNPDNAEARMLLASAYLGEAGVNVYTVFDSFKDVLFKKTLADTFWNAKPDPAEDAVRKVELPPPPKSVDSNEDKEPTDTLALEIVYKLDELLETLRKTGSLLARFPDIKKKNWVLLRIGLEHLDQIPTARDVALYKVFIRVIELRAFLKSEVLLDEGFKTRDWACQLEILKFREDLLWITDQLVKTAQDYKVAQPDHAVNLDGLLRASREVSAALKVLETDASPEGINVGTYTLQSRIRKAFRCSG